MASKATRWTFVQLSGPKKTIILEDHAAPHGRARKAEIYREPIKARTDRVSYAGNDVRSRFLAGGELPDIEIKGHWTDRWGGKGFAVGKKEEVKSFVNDWQPVRVTWSDILSFTGFISDFDPGVQGPGDVEWKMTIEVDVDNYLTNLPVLPNPPSPTTYTNRILLALTDPLSKLPDLPLDGDLLGGLDNLISDINGFTASVAGIADQIDGFANALTSQLRRLRAGIGQLRTAMVKLRNTVDNFRTNIALQSQRAQDRQKFYDVRSAIEASVVDSLKQLADMDRQAELAERGRIKALYVGESGDTWESVARGVYGDASRAGDIREANEIPAGQPPIPGAIYQIPR